MTRIRSFLVHRLMRRSGSLRHFFSASMMSRVFVALVLLCWEGGAFRMASVRGGRDSTLSCAPNPTLTPVECELATEGTIPCDTAATATAAASAATATTVPPASVSAKPIAPSVWTVFGELAAKTGASNLGQGFPDWSPPQFMLDSLQQAVGSPYHQYTRPAGHPPLVELLAGRYSKHLNRAVDPLNEVAITVGASQALYLVLTLFLRPADEIVIFEPFFDLYLKQIKLTGATPKYVPLGGRSATPEDPWAIDIEALARAITPRTKILVLNSPHNPTGKVLGRSASYPHSARLQRARSTHITHHSSRITHHPSRITHHPSLITHHSSPITHHAQPTPVARPLITHHPRPWHVPSGVHTG